ncbi:FAD-dependent monooxygenase [Halobacillus halophilus]|uniref:FAD-dependent monooxygenase n=1 Tax=Halobacillus halophilus TaxID=1570 RepID=UPI001CD1FB03|nr:FAD-dependent monooxygenase [Halobacillus halophilus]MCA1011683.1 FAD-dependent monooxygenase [Halobacillus halophilus]
MSSVIETDVLIIGAGPSGLMAANELQKRDVDFICLEKRAEPSDLSKALGIQARTLEMFELLGLHKSFLKKGYPGPGAKLHLGGEKPSLVELYHIKSRYPYLFIIPQSETEAILEDHLESSGGKVEREHEVVEVLQSDQGVYVSAIHEGELKNYFAKYLIACDGVHSKVRKDLSVDFIGKDEGFTFFLGDVDIPDLNEIYIDMTLNDHGAVAFFPYADGSYRVVGMDRAKQGLPHKDKLSLKELQESMDTILPVSYKVENPKWLTYFGTAHRQVPNYRTGRVFFVGDAAHIHNPLGGQGMNLGLQDASNLGWKLDAVLKGYANDSFLNSYHEERSPIGEDILKETSTMLKVINLDGIEGRIRNWTGKAALTQSWIEGIVANRLSHVYNEYTKTSGNKALRNSSLSRGALQAGKRIPDHLLFFDGTNDERLYPLIQEHGLLCFIYIDAQNQELIDYAYSFYEKVKEKYQHLLKIFLVAKGGTVRTDGDELPIIYDVHRDLKKKLGMEKGNTLVIRPDGHVAFHETSTDAEAMMDKLARFFS